MPNAEVLGQIFGTDKAIILSVDASGAFSKASGNIPVGSDVVPVLCDINGSGSILTITRAADGVYTSAISTNPLSQASQVPVIGRAAGNIKSININPSTDTVTAGAFTTSLTSLLGGVLGLVAEGDSLTIGTGLGGNYPSDMSRNVGIAVAANWAVGGATVPGMNADYPTQGGTSFNPLTANTYLFMGGTNDSGSGVPAPTTVANIQTHINLARNTGYQVALGTIPKRGDNPSAQAINNTINATLRSTYLAMGATWLMDFDLWPTLQNPADTFYYNADQLHFVNPGWLELAKCAQAGIGLASLSARGSNGALRFLPNIIGYKSSGAVPVFNVTQMQNVTLGNGSIAVLVEPITVKSVFAFQFVSGVVNFTNAGVMTAADVNVDMGFGPALTGGAGWYQGGGVFTAAASPNSGLGGYTNGDTVGVVVDPVTKQVWWTKDGTNFIGIGGLATLAQVIAGTNSTAQNWTGPVYAGVGAWSGGISVVVNSVPYPWTPPTGFVQG